MLFGAAADRAGTREIQLPIQDGATLGNLWPLLTDRHPGLAPMRDTLAFAVNGEYARMETEIAPDDEVAVLPPVSGG